MNPQLMFLKFDNKNKNLDLPQQLNIPGISDEVNDQTPSNTTHSPHSANPVDIIR